jgi:hypothetical protein
MPRPITRLFQLVAAASLCTLLGACQFPPPEAGPGKAGDGVTPNAVSGDEIKVTALDDAPAEAAASDAKPDTVGNDVAGKDVAGKDVAGKDVAAEQDPPPAPATEAEPAEGEAEAEAEAAPEGEPAPEVGLDEEPKTPKSDLQLACEKKKGKWSKVGKGELYACVYRTKDGGKQCERESQCEGVCLARSKTCSPFKPLYGCNEILQDNGAQVTLCLG